MKNRTKTTIKVRVFLDGKEFDASSLDKLVISNKTVDRIVNDVVDRMSSKGEEVAATAA
jgi:hypothetical protein